MSLYSGRNNMQDEYDYEIGRDRDEYEYEGYGNSNDYGSNIHDDGEEENIDEKGFEKRIQGDDDIFMFKKV